MSWRNGPTQLGKYQLLQRVAIGGMAEVFLGRAAGPAGFSKLVAIKRIHPHLADSEEFVEMFLDEARLASRLDHPNIVHIIDLGRVDEDYFLAMEYVHGKTLRQLVKKANEYGQTLPTDAVLTISIGVLSALRFAHTQRGQSGTLAPVIHRDISPQNILISYSGNVKLVDFGIAKAQDRIHVTQEGVIKGKAYYMAPEQMYEGRLDPRVDLYSFGVVLYEMLTSRKLFGKYTHSQMFNPNMKKDVILPSKVIPARPKELDPIVLRCLERDPDLRFQSASQLIAALEELMLTIRQVSSSERLSKAMHHFFAVEIQKEDEQLAQATASPPSGQQATQPQGARPFAEAKTFIKTTAEISAEAQAQPVYKAGPTQLTNTEAVTNPAIRTTAILEGDGTVMAGGAEGSASTPSSDTGSLVRPVSVTNIRRPSARRFPWAAIAIGGGLVLLAFSIGLHAILSGTSSKRPDRVSAVTQRQTLDAQPTATSLAPQSTDGAAGQMTRVRLRTRESNRVRLRTRTREVRQPPRRSRGHRRKRHPTQTQHGFLSVTSVPRGKVYLGRRCLGTTPLSGVKVPAGTTTLQLKNPALGVNFPFKVRVAAGQRATHGVQVGKGTLRVNAIPWARVYLDGKMLDVTPIKPIQLYAGPHVVQLAYPGPSSTLRFRTRITIRAGGNHKVIHNFLKEAR